jgi:hypothetical protein
VGKIGKHGFTDIKNDGQFATACRARFDPPRSAARDLGKRRNGKRKAEGGGNS